jgi:hypothetical protein
MNSTMCDEQKDACLRVLYEGLVAIRAAAWDGDAARCEQLADALHNLPDLVRAGDHLGWTVEAYVKMFLEPLVDDMPQAQAWKRALLRATVSE